MLRALLHQAVDLLMFDRTPARDESASAYPRLTRDAENRIRCVGCGVCEHVCPTKAIAVRAGAITDSIRDEYAGTHWYPARFDIAEARCVRCDECVRACPHEALTRSKEQTV